MTNQNTALSVLIIAASIFAGYYIVKNQSVPEPRSQKDVAVEETIEFVSVLDKIHPNEIKVIGAEEVEWPNSCLGLATYGEICAQVIVPGWKITLEADGQVMIFRTDRTGSSIRRDIGAESQLK